MFELTKLNVYSAADNGLLRYCRRPVKKPDAFFWNSEPSLGCQSISLDHPGASDRAK